MRPLAFALLLLAGCAHDGEPKVLVRTDGQRIPGNPALIQRAQADETICRGEVAKVAELATNAPWPSNIEAIFEGCMAQRGYIVRR